MIILPVMTVCILCMNLGFLLSILEMRQVNLCAGAQQTPQQIWTGLQSILPALQALLTACNNTSPEGTACLTVLTGHLTKW